MKKKTLALILCLLVCLCLAPAAHADSQGSEYFAALKQAISSGETNLDIRQCGTMVISESITIPSGLSVVGASSGTTVVIPTGVTLTIKGKLDCGGVTVQPGGHLTLNDGGTLSVQETLSYSDVSQFTVNARLFVRDWAWQNDLNNLSFGEQGSLTVLSLVKTDQELASAAARVYSFAGSKFRHLVTVTSACSLLDDMVVDDFDLNVGTMTRDGRLHSGLTVPDGVTLTICPGHELDMWDTRLKLNGSIVNYGRCVITRTDPALGVVVECGENGSFTGTQPLTVLSEDADSCLSGLDLGSFDRASISGGVAYTPKGIDSFTELKMAIESGLTYLELNNRGTIVFPESITIPSFLEVTFHNTTIVLPDGVELTVERHLNGSNLVLQRGSHVTVNGQLTVGSTLAYDSVSQFTVNGCLQVNNHSWTDGLRNLRLGSNALVDVVIITKNDGEFASGIAFEGHFPSNQYQKTVEIEYDCTLKEDLVVRGYHLDVWSGSLTIPEGITLTLEDEMTVESSRLYLMGTMVNHGRFSLKQREHEEPKFDVLMYRIGNGCYVGSIGVQGDVDKRDACLSGFDMSRTKRDVFPWSTVYFIPADLVLPNGLTRIEAEAFAGDSFRTVYIPEDVTYIDGSAFDDVEPLYVLGETGSYAETFARSKGYDFVDYTP